MAEFASPPLGREQLVLFSEKLDNIIPQDHSVRLLDDILEKLDWKVWTDRYILVRGQPPIHPRVLVAAILYGIHKRIRTSRALEEAIDVRTDFRWLVQGRSIDHTTISKFRTANQEAIKNLFVQVAVVARELGHLPLATLGFDGTRVRANNRRTGSRTPDDLRKAKAELAAKFAELEAKTAQADEQDDQSLGQPDRLSKELADVKRRQKKVDAALAEIDKLEKADQTVPARIPTTDPESRITPNKEGGFAPNYTPTATVDIDSGMIVASGVIPHTDEDKHMIPAVKEVMDSFSLDQPPKEMLADGMMSTGDNLAKCKELGIDLYSPINLGQTEDNPAIRADLSQSVAANDVARLPVTRTKHKDGTATTQFNKNAFVYDTQEDVYWCPSGKKLEFENKTSETENGRTRVRHRYLANESDCASCPLRSQCIKSSTNRRMVVHEQHEAHRLAHAQKMSDPESKKKYGRRRHSGERPFATIKSHFGLRNFSSRGLEKVRCEWNWHVAAFNLHRLMSLISQGTGPPISCPTAT
jgi:transposase